MTPPDESALDTRLSEPTPALVAAMAELEGDILVLGVSGKMGPSLARLAQRASTQARTPRRVIGVARFSDDSLRTALERDGITTHACDCLDADAVAGLPDAPHVIYMVGQKFGTTGQEALTWAINAYVPGVIAHRYSSSRIVAFSTGNVYPLSTTDGEGPSESDPTGPIGEYAQSALARERVFEYWSRRNTTPVALLRLNYAIEPRYGVLRDIADHVLAGAPVDLGMSAVNVMWQRDANAIAVRALAHAASPPLVLNVTGRPAVSVRWLAERFGEHFDRTPRFHGAEGRTALLSNAARCEQLFGAPPVGIEEMIEQVATWVQAGGRSLSRPTHFEEREGKF